MSGSQSSTDSLSDLELIGHSPPFVPRWVPLTLPEVTQRRPPFLHPAILGRVEGKCECVSVMRLVARCGTSTSRILVCSRQAEVGVGLGKETLAVASSESPLTASLW